MKFPCMVWLLSLFLLHNEPVYSIWNNQIESYRAICDDLISQGKAAEAFKMIERIQGQYGSLAVGDGVPSFYNLKGVALFEMNMLPESMTAFTEAVKYNGSDLRAWLNLLEIKMLYQTEDFTIMSRIEQLLGNKNMHGYSLSMNWENYEISLYTVEQNVKSCLASKDETTCEVDLIGVSYQHVPISYLRDYSELSVNFTVASRARVPLPNLSPTTHHSPSHPKTTLNIGILINHIDGGPIITLSQGLFRYLKQYKRSSHTQVRYHLTAFFVIEHKIQYEYQKEYLQHFHSVVNLQGLDAYEAATRIQSKAIEILLDMNGVSLSSSLLILYHRPAPIQISYLGDPITTGASFIDYYMADRIAVPAESIMRESFVERLLLFSNGCYLVNSYTTWQAHLEHKPPLTRHEWEKYWLQFVPALRHDWLAMIRRTPSNNENEDSEGIYQPKTHTLPNYHHPTISPDPTNPTTKASSSRPPRKVLGVFHGWTKITPMIFSVWMNILRRFPDSLLLFSVNGNTPAYQNLYAEYAYHGIDFVQQLKFLQVTPWDEHLATKQPIDLYLETISKNGHTTTLDATYASIPMITLAHQEMTMARSGQSIATYSEQEEYSLVYSLKEYEDLVIALLHHPTRLIKWKEWLRRTRRRNVLFNTHWVGEEWLDLLQATYELHHIQLQAEAAEVVVEMENAQPTESINKGSSQKVWKDKKKYHIFASSLH